MAHHGVFTNDRQFGPRFKRMPQSVVAVYFHDDSSVNLPVDRYRDWVQTRYVVLIREIF